MDAPARAESSGPRLTSRANAAAVVMFGCDDFGAINIDAELVAAVDGETITLQNGCICCTIKDDLLLSLFRLLRRPDPPAHVLIEASGVSDPAEVLKSFDDARVLDVVRLAAVIVVVDAEQYAAVEYRDQPLALHQLLVADLVILNKLDLIDEYVFLVHPRIAGHGPTLYEGGLAATRKLELLSAIPLRSGAVAMHYRRA